MKIQKKTIFALAVLASGLLAAQARAQAVPNGNLNAWVPRNGTNAPTSWLTTDDIVVAGTGFPLATGAVVQSADFRSSPFAARLENRSLLGNTLPGFLGLGTDVGNDGLPFTGQPARLEFYYKLSGTAAALLTDSAAAFVELTRTTANGPETLAAGFVVLTRAAAAYTLASVPLVYTNTTARPDTVHIGFQSAKFSTRVALNTVLTIDDVAFAGTLTATRDAALNAALAVAPNPSPDGRYRLTTSPEAAPGLLAAPLAVRDATGRVVLRQAATATAAASRTLDLSGLPEGIYTLQLFAPGGLVTRKLVR